MRMIPSSFPPRMPMAIPGSQREGQLSWRTAGVGVPGERRTNNSTAPTTNGELFSEPASPVAAPAEPSAAAEPKPAATVMEEPGPPVAVAQERPRTPAAGKAKAAAVRPSKRGRKSLKAKVAAEADLIDIPADEVLFGKQYYTMGEVSEMLKRQSIAPCAIGRPEFDILQPRKNGRGGIRLFPAGRYQEPPPDLSSAAAKKVYDRRSQGVPAKK